MSDAHLSRSGDLYGRHQGSSREGSQGDVYRRKELVADVYPCGEYVGNKATNKKHNTNHQKITKNVMRTQGGQMFFFWGTYNFQGTKSGGRLFVNRSMDAMGSWTLETLQNHEDMIKVLQHLPRKSPKMSCLETKHCWLKSWGANFPQIKDHFFCWIWITVCFFPNPCKLHFTLGKLTLQWNFPIFNWKYIFKGSIFHCHFSLPDCNIFSFVLLLFPPKKKLWECVTFLRPWQSFCSQQKNPTSGRMIFMASQPTAPKRNSPRNQAVLIAYEPLLSLRSY